MSLLVRAENGLKPPGKKAPAKGRRKPDPTCDHRTRGQNYQRHGHDFGRLVKMGPGMAIGTALTKKDQKKLAEHVERRQPRAPHPEPPQQRRAVLTGKSLPENFVLGKKASRQRRARNGQDRDSKGPERIGHMAPEPAHLPHVLFPAEGMDDAAGAEKEAGLEKGMGHEMEHGRAIGGHAGAQKHISK